MTNYKDIHGNNFFYIPKDAAAKYHELRSLK